MDLGVGGTHSVKAAADRAPGTATPRMREKGEKHRKTEGLEQGIRWCQAGDHWEPQCQQRTVTS